MYELKDYLNAINFSKEKLLDTDDTEWTKKYPPFVINKCLSMFYDCIAQAKEIDKMMTELKSSDYEHLILTFDKYWGWHVTLEFEVHPSSKVRK